MAYCLRSFAETLDQVLRPDKHYKKWVLDQDQRPQIQSLFENATFLQDFLDKSSPLIQEKIASLEDKIMNAAQKGADSLEMNITDHMLLNPEDQSSTIYPPDLGEVIRVFEDAKQDVIKMEDASQPSNHISTRYPDSKNMVVGVEDDLNLLRSRLTSARVTELDIIPIVGMGGIGKTTLARLLYDEYSFSKCHFDCCAWVTVSQIYNPQQILKTIITCVTGNEVSNTSDLITSLYQALVSRRYLIVLDDIWSSKAWDDVQRAFARDHKGSRIVFTSRENSLADYVKSTSHEMRLINNDTSWELLRGKVFGEESCPCELEEVGKRIASKCGGLPLALQVIGGLLAHSERTKYFWDYVAYNVSSLIATTDNQFEGIFSWSFAHLPHYLKPCFLYMGAFPEDFNIPASMLIKLWVAEGFLYPVPNKSLEEAAELHLNGLVNRNLVIVTKRTKNGKAKSYGVHDLLRDLCLRKAQEKKFLHVKDSKNKIVQEDILDLCRVSIHQTYNDIAKYDRSLKLTSYARSLLVGGYDITNGFVSRLCYESSLLRVLDVKYAGRECDYQEMVLQKLVNLRYLAIGSSATYVARGISVLKNLQTLTVTVLESLAIVEHLPQLRHLQFRILNYDDNINSLQISPHENLQCLSQVPLHDLTYCILEKIPNLTELGIDNEYSEDSVVDLTRFQKLESLSVRNNLHDLTLPQSLKELRLQSCEISQTLLHDIGNLPGLQVLKISSGKFENSTWEPSEGEFCQLQYLKINRASNLREWLATEIHFPVLRHLVLRYCHGLSDIPNDMGGIETLETIELDVCKASVFDSVSTILKEQREFGNTILQLRLGRAIEDM